MIHIIVLWLNLRSLQYGRKSYLQKIQFKTNDHQRTNNAIYLLKIKQLNSVELKYHQPFKDCTVNGMFDEGKAQHHESM